MTNTKPDDRTLVRDLLFGLASGQPLSAEHVTALNALSGRDEELDRLAADRSPAARAALYHCLERVLSRLDAR